MVTHTDKLKSLSLSFALALSAQWDILTQRKTFHRKHTTPNMFLYCAIVLALKFSLSSFSFFFPSLFHVLHPSFSLQKEVPLNGGIEEEF